MRRGLVMGLWVALTLSAGSLVDAAARLVPTSRLAPLVDGRTKDLAPALVLEPKTQGSSARWSAEVSVFKDRLYLGLTSKGDQATAGDLFEVSLHFPGAGAMTQGRLLRVSAKGLLPADVALGPPSFVAEQLEAAALPGADGFSAELALPVEALPRLPAAGPLDLELCVTYLDQDPAGPSAPVSNCQGGDPLGGPVRLPEALRQRLGLTPPQRAVGLEAAPNAWLAFDALRFPVWLRANEPLTPNSLARLVSVTPLEPTQAGIPAPPPLRLEDGRPLWAVFSGKDPFGAEGECDAEAEVRLALYAVKNAIADRVLEWPASSCTLGRVVSFELESDGALTLGFSGGSTAHFTWSRDHFENTVYGRR